MIPYVMLGCNNLDVSEKFYDAFFEPLGIIKSDVGDHSIGYANKDTPDNIIFYIGTPYNNEIATFGNGTMIAFKANSKKSVDLCHSNALKLGGKDEGKPGFRPPTYPDSYWSYVRDPDYNKLCVYWDSK